MTLASGITPDRFPSAKWKFSERLSAPGALLARDLERGNKIRLSTLSKPVHTTPATVNQVTPRSINKKKVATAPNICS
ncbi:MAG: hypothetical protein AB1813_26655 [Verrucomicrobiota bacterium]